MSNFDWVCQNCGLIHNTIGDILNFKSNCKRCGWKRPEALKQNKSE